jgi:hypothetical protein
MSTPPQEEDPLAILDQQYAWYRAHAVSAGVRYKVLEITLLVVAALIPVSTVITDRWVTALLGAVVVVLTGLRSIFTWQDDWMRCTESWQQLQFARTRYVHRLPPYDVEATRDALLVQRVQAVQTAETRGWLSLRADARSRGQGTADDVGVGGVGGPPAATPPVP